jgi:hypothetical protein
MQKQTQRLDPIRYVLLFSVSIKILCLIALCVFWPQLPREFVIFATILLVVIIAVQGRLLWKQWR